MDALTTLSFLPSELREVLVLREIQKKSYDEIAAALGLPRQVVALQLTRARRELMWRLGMEDNTARKPVGCEALGNPEVAG